MRDKAFVQLRATLRTDSAYVHSLRGVTSLSKCSSLKCGRTHHAQSMWQCPQAKILGRAGAPRAERAGFKAFSASKKVESVDGWMMLDARVAQCNARLLTGSDSLRCFAICAHTLNFWSSRYAARLNSAHSQRCNENVAPGLGFLIRPPSPLPSSVFAAAST